MPLHQLRKLVEELHVDPGPLADLGRILKVHHALLHPQVLVDVPLDVRHARPRQERHNRVGVAVLSQVNVEVHHF